MIKHFNIQQARDNIGVFMVCFAWSVSEVVRYLYYFHNLINNEIYMIKWLRYNMFIVLYPIGAFVSFLLPFFYSINFEMTRFLVQIVRDDYIGPRGVLSRARLH